MKCRTELQDSLSVFWSRNRKWRIVAALYLRLLLLTVLFWHSPQNEMLSMYILMNLQSVAFVHLNEFSIMFSAWTYHINIYSADYVNFFFGFEPQIKWFYTYYWTFFIEQHQHVTKTCLKGALFRLLWATKPFLNNILLTPSSWQEWTWDWDRVGIQSDSNPSGVARHSASSHSINKPGSDFIYYHFPLLLCHLSLLSYVPCSLSLSLPPLSVHICGSGVWACVVITAGEQAIKMFLLQM